MIQKDVSIKETTQELKDAVDNIQVRLEEAEKQIPDMQDKNALMERGMEKYDKSLNTSKGLKKKRLVGLKEIKEQKGNVRQYVEQIISEGPRLTGQNFKIEHAYRSLASKPDPE